jgi:hypothetical protein
VTWGTAIKPASTGSLTASSTSVNIGANVTLTPSLTSNQTINDIESTSYSISPNSGASINGNTFTASAAGTYTVTATITYNPDGYTSLTSTVTATTTITVKNEITYTINISTDGNGSVEPSGKQQIGISGMEVTATPTDPSKFRFTKWEVSSGVQVSDPYGATTTVTATAAGTVIAHFEELQPKTIYLKTVEGTTDGYK